MGFETESIDHHSPAPLDLLGVEQDVAHQSVDVVAHVVRCAGDHGITEHVDET